MSSAASRPPFSASQSPSQTATGLASTNSAFSNAELSNAASSNLGSAAQPSAQPADSPGARPPKRPQLLGPPARPIPPKPAPAPESKTPQPPPEPETPKLIGPISRPSERMQYRAIGLLKGKYVVSEEQFNRGNILLEDDTLIDAVLLGRVTSLIKKHIDLETNHLWVVYPRTLYKEEEDNEPALHMQIVGVWEPETLNASKGNESDSEAEADPQSPRYLSTVEATEQCDQFSIRGEIAKYAEESSEITVNIVQKSKSENVKPKRPFKLLINGTLEGRTTGYFWDFNVKREGGQLILVEATQVAVVPPKKKSKDARRDGGRKRAMGKPWSASAPASSAPKPMPKKKKAGGEGSQSVSTEAQLEEAKSVEAPLPSTKAEASSKASETVEAKSTEGKPTETSSNELQASNPKSTLKADAEENSTE